MLPDSPERILVMAERNQAGQQIFLQHESKLRQSGQRFGFFATTCATIVAILALYKDQPWVAALALSAVVAPVVRNIFSRKGGQP